MSAEVKEAFLLFKPICIEVSKNRDKVSIKKLHNLLKGCPADTIQQLNEYLLFPLRIILMQKQNVKEDAIIATADCMCCLFSHIHLNDWGLFQDICKSLIFTITTTEGGKIAPYGSENVKLSVVHSLTALVDISSKNLWKKFYHTNNVPFLGHLVTICVSIITKEKNKQLKIATLVWLKRLCKPSYANQIIEEKDLLTVMIGNCLLSFLPGILSALLKVAARDINEKQAVKCKALKILASLVKLCFGDAEVILANNQHIQSKINEFPADQQVASFKVLRNQSWVDEVGPKMDTIIQCLYAASDNSNPCVRLALVKFSQSTLTYCCKSTLKVCIGNLLKILIKLSSDENVDVANTSNQVISQFSVMSQENRNIADIIQDHLFELCSVLPKVMHKSLDDEKISNLKLLLGYINILKSDIKTFILSSAHLDNLLKTILYCFEMNYSDLYKIEEVTPVSSDYDSALTSFFKGQFKNWLFQKPFLHFSDDNICKILIEICRLVGQYGSMDVLLDFLIDCYGRDSTCMQAVVVINELLLGATITSKNDRLCNHIENLINIFTSPENWYLHTNQDSLLFKIGNVNDAKNEPVLSNISLSSNLMTKGVSMKTMNFNVVLTCLHLESLSTFSMVLERDFRKYLLTCLYPVLEKVNDVNHLISSCSLKTLQIISQSCCYSSIAELISNNSDYLVSTISVNLRHLNLFPCSPAVLQAMLLHGDIAMFPLVRDTLDEILSTLDVYRHNHVHLYSLLTVLFSTVKFINKWYFCSSETTKQAVVTDTCTDRSSHGNVQEIKDFLISYYDNVKTATMQNEDVLKNLSSNDSKNETEVMDNQNDCSSVSGEDEKMPAELTIVEQILNRLCHLLANKSAKVRLLVLDIVLEGIAVVSKNENVLLPIVHKLWDPLVVRCGDPELQIVSKAFNVICCMGLLSGTFVRRRFTKDILPKLLKFLSLYSEPNVSSSRNALLVYSHSTVFKLQRTILTNLGSLLKESAISFKDIHNICCVCSKYLSVNQPEDLQNSAVILFTYLIQLNSDFLWLFLSDIYTPTSQFYPPESSFKLTPITVAGSTNVHNEFAKNVLYLLSLC